MITPVGSRTTGTWPRRTSGVSGSACSATSWTAGSCRARPGSTDRHGGSRPHHQTLQFLLDDLHPRPGDVADQTLLRDGGRQSADEQFLAFGRGDGRARAAGHGLHRGGAAARRRGGDRPPAAGAKEERAE
jgi:hypothetical protein